MDATPTVSVIMPVFNAECYLRHAIESVIVQTYTDFEFLIIDDGSTDDSLDIVRSYADPRISVFAEPHRGIVTVLNKGLAEARGVYVARMDADDVSTPGRLMKQVAYMASHPNTVLVGSWAQVIDAQGDATGAYIKPPTHEQLLSLALCASNQFIHGSILMYREAALAVGGYRAEFATTEDYDLWLRLAEIGNIANLPEALYCFRLHEDSKTAHEGNLTEVYAERARQTALQRHLHKQDSLGYATVQGTLLLSEGLRNPKFTACMPTLSDWALAYMWQHQFRRGAYLLLRAVLSRPIEVHTWSILCQCCFSRTTVRVMIDLLRRVGWHVSTYATDRRVTSRRVR